MKIAGVIVLYQFGTDVMYNIRSYISEIEKLFVVDNSEPNNGFIQQDQIVSGFNFQYIGNKQNLGIAMVLIQVVEAVFKEGFEWLITMDQDSCFADDLFFRVVRNFSDSKDVAVFTRKFVSSSSILS